jgi:Arc/MetJ-type ribon-helix-helix transcriptional regulator
MHRTNIYLDPDQRAALRHLTAASGETMSDVVRRAIDRLLADEFAGQDWSGRLDALLARVDSRNVDKPEPTADDIQAAVKRSRVRRKPNVSA